VSGKKRKARAGSRKLRLDHVRTAIDFIKSDIGRVIQVTEIQDDTNHPERDERLKEAGVSERGGGNLLCALALLCHTEFAGTLIPSTRGQRPLQFENAFNAFLARMGTPYRSLLKEHDVYGILRSGAVHNYFMKKSFGVGIHDMPETEATNCGIVYVEQDDRYLISVKRYLKDFLEAFEVLYRELEERERSGSALTSG
jgi:hypothetical protein